MFISRKHHKAQVAYLEQSIVGLNKRIYDLENRKNALDTTWRQDHRTWCAESDEDKQKIKELKALLIAALTMHKDTTVSKDFLLSANDYWSIVITENEDHSTTVSARPKERTI